MSETSARLVVKSDDEVLMTLGDTGTVKFFGGRMKYSETPKQTAIREAREEGGIELNPRNVYELPYQENDPARPSFWFGVNTARLAVTSLSTGDDVQAAFWVSLSDVESRLSYPFWKQHWREQLLPSLR